MVEIVNVVASGSLPVELDLRELADDIGRPVANYNPDNYPGLYIRFEDDAPLITVYRTGKYIITGADSEEESNLLRNRFLNYLFNMSVIDEPSDEWFRIQNYVCTGELERSQNLNSLAIILGLENTEYEPEQFPGLIYRPNSFAVVILIFATGRVVLTGSKDVKTAEDAFEALQQELENIE